ncbi:MAG TPA: polyprenyl synthetase family protein [Thermoanaerobaculia bacterium]|nr:polyprenyl synthetase family protein [Thermoanaerobaculia bacterium]
MTYFDQRRALIDEHLRELAGSVPAPPPLSDPIREALASAGKRVRGVLTIAVGEALGAGAQKLLDAAAAMEMIHASSLILDDLPAMDDAMLRRGRPALHRAHGEDLAILTAVALLNHAYGLVAKNHAALSPRRWSAGDVVQRLVDAVGWDGTIAGEAVDLHSGQRALDLDTLEFIHSRKTGALFVAAAAVGAMLANADAATVRRIEIYAKNLGLAFQITDDVLDVTGTAEELGKDVGKDEQKLTFVKLAGVDGARQLAGELVETSLAAIATMRTSADPLRQLATMVRDRTK